MTKKARARASKTTKNLARLANKVEHIDESRQWSGSKREERTPCGAELASGKACRAPRVTDYQTKRLLGACRHHLSEEDMAKQKESKAIKRHEALTPTETAIRRARTVDEVEHAASVAAKRLPEVIMDDDLRAANAAIRTALEFGMVKAPQVDVFGLPDEIREAGPAVQASWLRGRMVELAKILEVLDEQAAAELNGAN